MTLCCMFYTPGIKTNINSSLCPKVLLLRKMLSLKAIMYILLCPMLQWLCNVVWCGVVWCIVVWCGVLWCSLVQCGIVQCGVVQHSVVWRSVVQHSVLQRSKVQWAPTWQQGRRPGQCRLLTPAPRPAPGTSLHLQHNHNTATLSHTSNIHNIQPCNIQNIYNLIILNF